MNSTLSLFSLACVWTGAAVTVVGLAGCDGNVARPVVVGNGMQAATDPPHACRARDAMSTQKGCRPALQTVGTK